MKLTIELLKLNDLIRVSGAEWRYVCIDENNALWYSDNEYFLSSLPPQITSWFRGNLDMLKAIKCPECLDGSLKANSSTKDCHKCKGLGYLIPAVQSKPRFEIRTGKYGQFFYDYKAEDGITLLQVVTLLNKI